MSQSLGRMHRICSPRVNHQPICVPFLFTKYGKLLLERAAKANAQFRSPLGLSKQTFLIITMSQSSVGMHRKFTMTANPQPVCTEYSHHKPFISLHAQNILTISHSSACMHRIFSP
jgi:hypothetical protein